MSSHSLIPFRGSSGPESASSPLSRDGRQLPLAPHGATCSGSPDQPADCRPLPCTSRSDLHPLDPGVGGQGADDRESLLGLSVQVGLGNRAGVDGSGVDGNCRGNAPRPPAATTARPRRLTLFWLHLLSLRPPFPNPIGTSLLEVSLTRWSTVRLIRETYGRSKAAAKMSCIPTRSTDITLNSAAAAAAYNSGSTSGRCPKRLPMGGEQMQDLVHGSVRVQGEGQQFHDVSLRGVDACQLPVESDNAAVVAEADVALVEVVVDRRAGIASFARCQSAVPPGSADAS